VLGFYELRKDFLTLDIQFLKKNSHPAWQNLGGYCPSFDLSNSFNSFGFALPCVAFIA
jgi:hypothetical protein